MTKHDLLTEVEFQSFKPPKRIIEELNAYVGKRGIQPQKLRVLDWGCGRGRTVLWLRENGFDGYGVDIDIEPVENGLHLLREKEYPDDILTVLDRDGKSPYPDYYFDFVFSGNVFEHVSNMEMVSSEIGRITKAGGAGFHIFPAQKQLKEGHLFMPFVHWFPAGSFRKFLIKVFVQAGIEPHWKEMEGHSLKDKVDTYYQYSVNKIHYRNYKKVRSLFEKVGFEVKYTTISNTKLQKNPITRLMLKNRYARKFLHHLLLTFKQVEMLTVKKP